MIDIAGNESDRNHGRHSANRQQGIHLLALFIKIECQAASGAERKLLNRAQDSGNVRCVLIGSVILCSVGDQIVDLHRENIQQRRQHQQAAAHPEPDAHQGTLWLRRSRRRIGLNSSFFRGLGSQFGKPLCSRFFHRLVNRFFSRFFIPRCHRYIHRLRHRLGNGFGGQLVLRRNRVRRCVRISRFRALASSAALVQEGRFQRVIGGGQRSAAIRALPGIGFAVNDELLA